MECSTRRGLLASLVLGLSLALGLGCVNVGREFPVQPVRTLVIGSTTQQQVSDLFGRPWRTGLENGERTWTYASYQYSLFSDAQTRDLVIRFDAEKVVSSYTFNSTHPEDEQP